MASEEMAIQVVHHPSRDRQTIALLLSLLCNEAELSKFELTAGPAYEAVHERSLHPLVEDAERAALVADAEEVVSCCVIMAPFVHYVTELHIAWAQGPEGWNSVLPELPSAGERVATDSCYPSHELTHRGVRTKSWTTFRR